MTQSGPTERIWRDGEFVAWEDASLHVMSHCVHYGSGVFEGVRFYETPEGPAIFRVREHMRRLLDSARLYRMPVPYDVDALVEAAVATVQANDMSAGYLRPLIVRTGQHMGINPETVPVETFIIAWHWGRYLGDDGVANGVDVCISSWRRAAPSTFPVMAKATGNYLPAQLVKMAAQQDGYVEGIMLDYGGHVAEGSGENLFLVRDGQLFTPPLAAGILRGITRDAVLTLAHDLGIPVTETVLPRELLMLADEAFFCGTAAEITPIRSVDRQPIGAGKPGPITRAIQDAFMGIATGRRPDQHGWLTPVPAAQTA